MQWTKFRKVTAFSIRPIEKKRRFLLLSAKNWWLHLMKMFLPSPDTHHHSVKFKEVWPSCYAHSSAHVDDPLFFPMDMFFICIWNISKEEKIRRTSLVDIAIIVMIFWEIFIFPYVSYINFQKRWGRKWAKKVDDRRYQNTVSDLLQKYEINLLGWKLEDRISLICKGYPIIQPTYLPG